MIEWSSPAQIFYQCKAFLSAFEFMPPTLYLLTPVTFVGMTSVTGRHWYGDKVLLIVPVFHSRVAARTPTIIIRRRLMVKEKRLQTLVADLEAATAEAAAAGQFRLSFSNGG